MRQLYRHSTVRAYGIPCSATGIDKRFGGASALTAAHFELAAGEVHALSIEPVPTDVTVYEELFGRFSDLYFKMGMP